MSVFQHRSLSSDAITCIGSCGGLGGGSTEGGCNTSAMIREVQAAIVPPCYDEAQAKAFVDGKWGPKSEKALRDKGLNFQQIVPCDDPVPTATPFAEDICKAAPTTPPKTSAPPKAAPPKAAPPKTVVKPPAAKTTTSMWSNPLVLGGLALAAVVGLVAYKKSKKAKS